RLLRSVPHAGVLLRRARRRGRRCLRAQPHQRRHPAAVSRRIATAPMGVRHRRLRQAIWHQRGQPRHHAPLQRVADPRTDQGSRRLRAVLVMHILAFALTWEPELHGLLVVLLALILLPGTVYLLLSTNLGARVGFIIAAAAVFGWMALMGIVWTVYGIGLKGNPNAWKVQAMVEGDVAQSANPGLDGFPNGWKKLDLGTPEVAEAGAAADPTLAPPADSGKTGPYTGSSDYLPVGAYDKGGEK